MICHSERGTRRNRIFMGFLVTHASLRRNDKYMIFNYLSQFISSM